MVHGARGELFVPPGKVGLGEVPGAAVVDLGSCIVRLQEGASIGMGDDEGKAGDEGGDPRRQIFSRVKC